MGYAVIAEREKARMYVDVLLPSTHHTITHYLLTAIGLLLDCYWTATGLLLDCYWNATVWKRWAGYARAGLAAWGSMWPPERTLRKNAVTKFRDLGLSVGFHSTPERASRGTVDGIKD